LETIISRFSPMWARFLFYVVEATILIVLQVHNAQSILGWCVFCLSLS